jgi:hypothetical protein
MRYVFAFAQVPARPASPGVGIATSAGLVVPRKLSS